jgi:hypothetical protein
MTANTDFGSSALGIIGRFVALAVLAIGTVLALVFFFAAALVVGVMVLGALAAMRLMPKRATGRDDVLEARQTPSGWVVETAARNKS